MSQPDDRKFNAPNDRIWILLVQKSPKGPFTLAEVNALLDKGIIRRNDLALKMETKEAGLDGKKAGGNWKILWQYPEFDRRQEEPSAMTEISAMFPSREGERRRVAAADEAEKADLVKELLPEELGEIQPEDLIGKTSREIREESASQQEVNFNSDSVRPPDDEAGAPKWIYALLLLAVGGGFYGYLSRIESSPSKNAVRPGTNAGASEALPTGGAVDDVPTLNSRRGISSSAIRQNFVPAVRRNAPGSSPQPQPRIPEPSRRDEPNRIESDRGEISSNEESSLDKPADERQDEPVENVDEDGNPSPVPLRKPAGRKAKAAVSEEEAPGENSGQNSEPEPSNNQESVSPSDESNSDSN